MQTVFNVFHTAAWVAVAAFVIFGVYVRLHPHYRIFATRRWCWVCESYRRHGCNHTWDKELHALEKRALSEKTSRAHR